MEQIGGRAAEDRRSLLLVIRVVAETEVAKAEQPG